VGVQVKTVKSPENTCHTWALLRWWFTTKRRHIKCMHLHLYLLCAPIEHLPNQLNYLCSRIQNSFNCPCNKKLHRTTNCAMHSYMQRGWPNKPLPHTCYYAEFGRSTSTGVSISRGTAKLEERVGPVPLRWRAWLI